MLEIPESHVLAQQLNETIQGKIISFVRAGQTPHSFTWYSDNPEGYDDLLAGKRIGISRGIGGMLETEAEDCRILLGDGVSPKYHEDSKKAPARHQLYLEFDDNTAITCTVQMYGGIWAFPEGTNDSPYYAAACEKPSPLTEAFDYPYFLSLRKEEDSRLSAKAYLATKQRIPGLGNGTLQDILFTCGIHPKRKMADVNEEEYHKMYDAVKSVLREMADKGGRDTEKDLFGQKGGYSTILSKNTLWSPCPRCGYELRKGNYLGGTIYYCEHCQK